MNLLYYGDNLEVLRRHVGDETVDLVYLDPPFNSNASYNVLFAERDGTRAAAQVQAFEDTWKWTPETARTCEETIEAGGGVAEVMRALRSFIPGSDMLAYLAMMAPRLVELRRVLKPTGSLYLHCDPTASHYLKMLMDAVFGPEHFRNEIVWRRHNARRTDQRWPRIHDILLFYSKSQDFTFRSMQVSADRAKMPHTLITGPDGQRYQTFELTGAGVTKDGESGRPWHGFDPAPFGRHWANSHVQMDAWDKAGLIHWPKPGPRGGFPRRRAAEVFIEEERKVTVGDVWTDIDRLNQTAKERLGYPTQKPEALLERIISASSNEGDTVLDAFCGCGTTIAAAQKLNRRWIGIDITYLAISLIRRRLRDAYGESIDETYRVIGEPAALPDAAALAASDPFQFQWWITDRAGAHGVEQKKGADRGIDGRLYFHDEGPGGKTKQVILSVKAGHILPAHLRDLYGVVTREKAEIGVLLCLEEPSKAMRREAANAGFYHSPWGTNHPVLQIITVAELLEGKRIDLPAERHTSVTFKRAPKAKGRGPQQLGLTEGV